MLASTHPRLILTQAILDKLRTHPDAFQRKLISQVLANAESVLGEAPIERVVLGRRLLAQSQRAFWRISNLALAYRLTEEPRLRDRAIAEMLAAAGFEDWNPSHFLDVAVMAAAMAIGSDWLHAELDESTRAKISQSLIDKALLPGLADAPHNWWYVRANNWNQVCFGGLVLGALAIQDVAPEIAGEVIDLARRHMHHGMEPYAPDGAYPEGPSYWEFGTSYSVLLVGALRTATGQDWEIPQSPGFLPSAVYRLVAIGSSGKVYNYADNSQSDHAPPVLLWFAAETGWHVLAESVQATIDCHDRMLPFALLWYAPMPDVAGQPLPLNWIGQGPNPIAVHRTGWSHDSAFAGIKGGMGNMSHAQLDAGSFVYDARGIRWVVDLGPENYHRLESSGIDLWNRAQDSSRWTVFRNSNHAHSTLSLGDTLHRVDGFAPLSQGDAGPSSTIVDLTHALGTVASARRSLQLLPDGQLQVHDILGGVTDGVVPHWQILTGALVEVQDDGLLLIQDGQRVRVRIEMEPPPAVRVFPAAELLAGYDSPLPGLSVIRFDLPVHNGNAACSVCFEPLDSLP